MQGFQKQFIELAISQKALCFGEFELKSGRLSPYFFNAGLFNSGSALAELGRCYASAIEAAELDYDVLFGPAYKGIPLASTTAVALADHHQRDVPYAYNRKEAKAHGEGGSLVGAPLKGSKVLITDDVITAGTAVREVVELIRAQGAEVAGVVIGLNRQERGKGQLSAIQEVERDFGIPVISIINLAQVINYLKEQGSDGTSDSVVASIAAYRDQYGIAD